MRGYAGFPITSKAHILLDTFPYRTKQGSAQYPGTVNWQNTGLAACRWEVAGKIEKGEEGIETDS